MLREQNQQEEEVSLRELINKAKEIWSYLIKKWIFILFAGIVGAGIGFAYAWSQPVKYESKLSFVVEESKAGVGGLASLAGQFGFDIGGSGGGGVFSGDNILLFFKSENLCREVLLTSYDSSGRNLLADKYAEANELKSAWVKKKEIGQVNFAQHNIQSRLQDSLLKVIINRILTTELSVSKPDKKASFIEIKVTMRDELLSKYFAERLVNIATERYIDSKIKVKTLNVAKLQRRADSLGSLLNNRTYSVAAQQQNLVDLNPALKTASVSTEITARDKTMIATIFAEVTKNLEIAKVALSQETPSIQMVDTPILPLEKKKASKLMYLLLGGTICGLVTTFFFIVKRQLQ